VETILLVEDAAPLRAVIRELLENSGYTILEAEDGEQAIHIAQNDSWNSFCKSSVDIRY